MNPLCLTILLLLQHTQYSVTAEESDETDENLREVGLGPEELSMLDDFEVKLLRDSIRGVGSVSRGIGLFKSPTVPEFDFGPINGAQGVKQQATEDMIPVGGGFADTVPQIMPSPPPLLRKHKEERQPKKHKLKPRRKKGKKHTQKDNNSDLSPAEQRHLAEILELILSKKKKDIKELKKPKNEEWEDIETETEPTTTRRTTTTPASAAPVTLTQRSNWAVSTEEVKKPASGRRGLSIITEQEEEEKAEFVVGNEDKDDLDTTAITIPAQKILRGDEQLQTPTNTDDVINSKLVDAEVEAKNPQDWEQKMRALTRELGFVLQKLKIEKETAGILNRTNYDAKPNVLSEFVDGNTNNLDDNDRKPQQRKAFVSILREGLARQTDINEYVFIASITLIRDQNHVILVDTGLATDINGRTDLLNKLSKLDITPPQVNYVITTHGHPDHSGNTNDFPDAIHFQGNMLHQKTKFNFSDLFEKDYQQLTPNVQLIKSPGHTPDDISVLVKNTDKYGTVAVAGDVFIAEEDMKFPLMWKPMAWNERIQEKSRQRLICEADYIIPGHGKVFKVRDEMRIDAECAKVSGSVVPML
ncbi:unnamed protein product [Bursaphelenchus okinawaensis]|uniref:Metallo-beta-lactamase domain-containing protein 1 n=1 Tax=Bursaphelenchus okinawaensis TaxID=465554 RepID=A0A811LJ36_9BILA|nr:unnamed protein product [Bursaphelenchus okinawaensis]CAG9124174.1 unnamed protein product [Bursaphelenchus okinawaensis]